MQFGYGVDFMSPLPKKLAWLEKEISDGRPFIAGDTFSIADITGMAAVLVCDFLKIDIPSEFTYIHKWINSMRSRPSFSQGNIQ